MLLELLRTVHSAGVHSLSELARQLNVSEALIRSMMDELARMGYLDLLNSGSPLPGVAECGIRCNGCPIASTCRVGGSGHAWVLTEAGQRIVQENAS